MKSATFVSPVCINFINVIVKNPIEKASQPWSKIKPRGDEF